MIKPPDIEDDNREIIVAAAAGDAPTVRRLLDRDPTLGSRGYFYTPPIHFAVREGHAEIVQMLRDAGADSEWNGYYGESLIGMAGNAAMMPSRPLLLATLRPDPIPFRRAVDGGQDRLVAHACVELAKEITQRARIGGAMQELRKVAAPIRKRIVGCPRSAI